MLHLVVAPLRRNDRGSEVANLQDALVLLLQRNELRTADGAERAQLLEALARERQEEVFAPTTFQLIGRFQDQQQLRATGEVDVPTAAAINQKLKALGALGPTEESEFVVHGRVYGFKTGQTVVAYDRDLRGEEPLGSDVPDSQGNYSIPYNSSQFKKAEKGNADLRVVLLDESRKEVRSSRTVFNAPKDCTIDLEVEADASEYERYVAELRPALDGVSLLDIKDAGPPERNPIDFLAGDTGIERQHIVWLCHAVRLEKDHAGVPAEAFYGWFRRSLPTDWQQLIQLRLATLRQALIEAIDGLIVPVRLRNDLDAILSHLPNDEAKELAGLPSMAGLPKERVQAVLAKIDAMSAVSDAALADLVQTQVLKAAEAQAIGLNVSLHRLTGGKQKIVSSVLDSTFATVKTGRVRDVRDLASLEVEDWNEVLVKSGIPVEKGTERHGYGRALAMDAAREFPNAAMMARATRVPKRTASDVSVVQRLIRTNKNAIARDFDTLDLEGVSEPDRASLKQSHGQLQRLANRHPGLGVLEVLSEPGDAGATAAQVKERVDWVGTVLDLNPSVDFLGLDYLPDSADVQSLKFGDLSPDARARVVDDLKANQRVFAVVKNAVCATEIMESGYHSGSAIAAEREPDFAARTGLPSGEARTYHLMARRAANDAAMHWMKAYEVVRDRATTPIRTVPTTTDFLAPLKGLAELIKDQPWCECEDCQSVLSPAAYFVDLMYYIEQNILKDSFNGHEKHALHLAVRRRDLWDELELTCENTDTYIPYLDIVNPILERYIENNVAQAKAVGVYAHLADQEGSFKQPFNLPLVRLETLVGHFDLSRYRIVRAMGADKLVRACARLRLSKKAFDLIADERTSNSAQDKSFFKRLYKLPANTAFATEDEVMQPVSMQTLIAAMDLPHDTVEDVLRSSFVNSDGSTVSGITLEMTKGDPDDVQNTVERVNGLTLRRLDRIHRFTRLWRMLSWTIKELDHVLVRLGAGQATARIDGPAVAHILDLLEADPSGGLAVDELMALGDEFPAAGLRQPTSLFDRLFNQAPFLNRDGKWPPDPAVRFTHPAWKKNAPIAVSDPDNNSLARLLAGLQAADKELLQLVESLAAVADLGYKAGTNSTDESILLSSKSLTILYRHARAARLVGASVSDFVKLFALSPIALRLPGQRYIRDLDDVSSIVEFVTWQRDCGFSAEEIAYLIDGSAPSPKGTVDSSKLVGDIIAGVQREKSLEFADTLLAQLGLTEIESRKAVEDNTSTETVERALERVPGAAAYRLRVGVDPSTVPLTLDANFDAPAIRRLLGKYDALRVLDVSLAGSLQASPEQVALIRALARPGLSAADISAIAKAMQGSADTSALSLLIGEMVRFRTLLKSAAFDVDTLAFARDYRAVFFAVPGNPGNQAIALDVIRNVAGYVALATNADADFTTASAPADRSAIHAVLTDIDAATDSEIAKALRTDTARVAALRPHILPLPDNPFEALAALSRCLALSTPLGVSGETLKLVASDAFADLSRAAEDIYGAFRAKYPDEKAFAEKAEPYEDKLRSRKRDGLVDYVITAWPEIFADPGKLYQYFLVDVLVEGCARTSKLVAAISSLQLYVYRVLMNLEHSADWNGTIPVEVGVYARFTVPDKREEWYWRKNFRVWQANRRIFLYPENYIEPELRDDKTPLFKELEETLLLQEISDTHVHDAYGRYLAGFDEVGRLGIAGACYDAANKVMHLFGVTQQTPPVYYHRTSQETDTGKTRLSAWSRLTLQIPGRKLSAIVFEEQLFVFWLETTTRPQNSFVGGSSQFTGYRHSMRIRYSARRTDGTWCVPQALRFWVGGSAQESLSIDDPIDAEARKAMENERDALVGEQEAKQRDLTNAVSLANDAAQLERVARAVLDQALLAPPDVLESLAIGVATTSLVSVGVPPSVAFTQATASWRSIKTAVEHGTWLRAVEQRGKTANALKAINDRLGWIAGRLAALDKAIKEGGVRARWDKSSRSHLEPIESYKPEGWEWDRVYPDILESKDGGRMLGLTFFPTNELGALPPPVWDLWRVPGEVDVASAVVRPTPSTDAQHSSSAWRVSVARGVLGLTGFASQGHDGQEFYLASMRLNNGGGLGSPVAQAPTEADVQVVNGDSNAFVIEARGQATLMRKIGSAPFILSRLGTTLPGIMAKHFGYNGANTLLNNSWHDELVEASTGVSASGSTKVDMPADAFDLQHPYLGYTREALFHIPFLIANHLNSQQKFAECQRWYHHIFDPTAADSQAWRYKEFKDPTKTTQSLRQMLIDPDALAAYRGDPFNPHAIARTRLGAYQKSIVMKYIDNLLDWGDDLFSQFTMESVNEATMLYVMAQDILGPRPPALGPCLGADSETKKTYASIQKSLRKTSDFLVEFELPRYWRGYSALADEMERFVIPTEFAETAFFSTPADVGFVSTPEIAGEFVGGAFGNDTPWTDGGGYGSAGGRYYTTVGGTTLGDVYARRYGSKSDTVLGTKQGAPTDFGKKDTGPVIGGAIGTPDGEKVKVFDTVPWIDGDHDLGDRQMAEKQNRSRRIDKFDPVDIVPKSPLFCIPPNNDLRAYWDRVEDRLFKIRNCMDIAGVRSRLELFSPEIDPRLLVRMRAAGLTLDDVLNSTSGNLPPYRFTYLIEKARQYAATVQSFGSQLLGAIERRDNEELNNLRAVHEQNLLKMRARMMQLEIDAAEDTIEGLRRQKAGAEYRQQYFRSLISVGLIAPEQTQQQYQRTASGFRTAASIAQFVSAVLSIIPDMGAPTAMKFGGSQLGAAGRATADGFNAIAAFHEMSASMAGMEASGRRRDQEWTHQVELAKREIVQIEKQVTAAELRRDIAVRSLEVHEKTVDQAEELFEFFRDKFSNFGRYTWLSNRLHQLYRTAFNSALAVTRMTEQAFRAERTGTDTPLAANYWDGEAFGLLAGERMLNDLQILERRFIETNYRQLEISQSFSLAQFAPLALESLSLTGTCDFDVPEWFFDVTYPGQYRRRLRAVRLSIPCVIGPYANIGATLRLKSSDIRLSATRKEPVPQRHTVTIVASKAQYDAGVFDFNFRDERYMPFEGAGAISSWQLSLPSTLRTFDYGTISDVILHLDYTADYDARLEAERKQAMSDVLSILSTQPLTRLFSLREEFPEAFHRLVSSPPETPVTLLIEERHLPFFLTNLTLSASALKVRFISDLTSIKNATFAIGPKIANIDPVVLKAGEPAEGEQHTQGVVSAFELLPEPRDSPAIGVASGVLGEHVMKLIAAGPLQPTAGTPGNHAVDASKLKDIVLEISYRIDNSP